MGKCKICGVYDQYAPPNVDGECYCYLHFNYEKKCFYCGETSGVELESSRTMCPWDGKGENPNKSIHLCRLCAKEHHEYWNDMWDDYYYSRL
jgi:hypothetical protein